MDRALGREDAGKKFNRSSSQLHPKILVTQFVLEEAQCGNQEGFAGIVAARYTNRTCYQ